MERHWASFWHEAELMSRLNHPNVLRFFGLVVDGPMVVGIMTGGLRSVTSRHVCLCVQLLLVGCSTPCRGRSVCFPR